MGIKNNGIFSSSFLRAALAACAGILGQCANADDLYLGNMKADRILFLGNSITYHPARPDIGWYGNWGMAASAASKDYVHVLTSSVAQAAGGVPQTMVTTIGAFEKNYATYDLDVSLQAELAFQPNVVVVGIGENVPDLDTPQSQAEFSTAFGNLLSLFAENGDPMLFVRSTFWPDSIVDGILKQRCEAAGGVFIDISDLARDPSNRADYEREWENAGVGAHPGDKGMAAIAGVLYDAMAAHGGHTPEPSSLILLFTGSVALLLIWRTRRES